MHDEILPRLTSRVGHFERADIVGVMAILFGPFLRADILRIGGNPLRCEKPIKSELRQTGTNLLAAYSLGKQARQAMEKL